MFCAHILDPLPQFFLDISQKVILKNDDENISVYSSLLLVLESMK